MTRSTISSKDRDILRRLGAELAEAAADPVNEERREIHRRVDRMEPGRPSITIIQEPWNELNVGGELDPCCTDDFLRGIERELRMTLYKWRHHPGDMVVEAAVGVGRCVQDTGFGIAENVDIVRTDADSDVVSRHFHIQIREEADIAKIKTPRVSHDAAATQERYEKAASAFDGALKVNLYTPDPFGWFAPWDEIVRLTGVEEVLTDMIDRPEYVHKLVSHFVDCWLARLDQYESPWRKILMGDGMNVSFGRYSVWKWYPMALDYCPDPRHLDGAQFIMVDGHIERFDMTQKPYNLYDPGTWDPNG